MLCCAFIPTGGFTRIGERPGESENEVATGGSMGRSGSSISRSTGNGISSSAGSDSAEGCSSSGSSMLCSSGLIMLTMAASVAGGRLPSLITTRELVAAARSGGALIRIREMAESGSGAGSSASCSFFSEGPSGTGSGGGVVFGVTAGALFSPVPNAR